MYDYGGSLYRLILWACVGFCSPVYDCEFVLVCVGLFMAMYACVGLCGTVQVCVLQYRLL